MKIEIDNKQLEEDLGYLAYSDNMTLEMCISHILKEYVKNNSREDYTKFDSRVSTVKKEADKLADDISIRLTIFEQRFGVNVKLIDDRNSYSFQNRCNIEVTL